MLEDQVIQSTPKSIHLSYWTSNPVWNRYELGRKDRAEEGRRNSTVIFDNFCVFFFENIFRSLWHASHSTMEPRVDVFLSTQFACAQQFW